MTDRPSRVQLAPPPDDEERTDPGFKLPRRRPKIPWALVAALGVYLVGVGIYAEVSTRSSPDYQAAQHYVAARELIGADGCRHCTRAQLTRAYSELLEAARLEPQVASFQRTLEHLNWRFDAHGWKLPGDFKERAEAVALLYERIQQAHQPLLVVGARDQGWDPDQLLERPETVAKWGAIGGLGIIVLWFAMRYGEQHRRAMARHENLEAIEAEIAESEKARRRG